MNRLKGIKIKDEEYYAEVSTAEVRSEELILRKILNELFTQEGKKEFNGRSMPLDIFLKRYANSPFIQKRGGTKRRLAEIMLDELSFIGVESKVIQSDDSEIFVMFKMK